MFILACSPGTEPAAAFSPPLFYDFGYLPRRSYEAISQARLAEEDQASHQRRSWTLDTPVSLFTYGGFSDRRRATDA
jgi:hypothetical protein